VLNSKNLNKLVDEALAIEVEAAKEAGAIGYMARVLTRATLPHKKVEGSQFKRSNGVFSLSVLAPEEVGLPYGTIPRLLLSWLTTEAVRTKTPELILGHTLSEFMTQLGLVPTGGCRDVGKGAWVWATPVGNALALSSRFVHTP
jgi:Plasmid encoded RepA protein